MDSFHAQIKRNAVALISLAVALGSLGYNTWRNETTEAQRNVRHAAFRVLETLGALQEITDYRYYYLPYDSTLGREGELRVRGFGHVAMIRDLMGLMPGSAPVAGQALDSAWKRSINALDDLTESGEHTLAATEAEQRMTQAIGDARQEVLEVLAQLE